ncbi:enolase-phosphatase E1 isoform X1 [Hydra vulgaris]|nr:enolase-phosphatase E1 [Hydra vulgaris]
MTNESFKSILIDIEGTTVPISFVKDILFPYVRIHLRQYLEKEFSNDECQEALRDLSNLALENGTLPIINLYDEKEKIVKDTLDNVFWQMDSDMKTTALKKLQGLVWKSGFNSKQLVGEVFPDVVPALKKWNDDGINLYIYSSGSVNAQKLLFRYSDQGDMLEFFKGHFDTAIGSKIEEESYLRIAEKIKTAVEDILFLTDSVNEARAATSAGIKTVLLIRPGNQDLPPEIEFECVKSFDDISVFKNNFKK